MLIEPLKVGQTQWTITLRRKLDKYRWQRNDGEWVSPEFSTAEAAHYMGGKVPFLTDSEWKEHYPLPGPESEIQDAS